MGRACGVGGIESAFAEILEEYGRELDESLEADMEYAGMFAVNELSRTSPSDSGKYAGGWDYAIEKDGYGGVSAIVHEKGKPSLTHLLEKGHANVDGGWTGAREHIEPVFERAAEVLERTLRNG